jgi:outer membrane protein assembly factor BamB
LFPFLLSLFSCLPVGSTNPRSSSHWRRRLQKFTVNYYSQPELEWMVRLDEDMNQGNAVVQSPFDEGILYVVTHSGSLIVLSAKDGETLATVNPTPRSLTSNGQVTNWALYCNSGISFAETSSGDNFLVYSIVDDPPEMSEFVFEPET